MLKQWMTRLRFGRTTVGTTLTDERPDPQFESSWRESVRRRMLVPAIVVGVWAVALEAKLAVVQIVQHSSWAARALDQQFVEVDLPGVRGDIVDRTGETLAITVPGYLVYVDQRGADQNNLRAEAAEICAALQDCTAKDLAEIASKLKGRKHYVPIRPAANTTVETAARLQELNRTRAQAKKRPIVNTIVKPVRFYPKKKLAAHVIGAVDVDGKGIAGIESRYDSKIAGSSGVVHVQVDGRVTARGEIQSEVIREPTAGAGLELTIDAQVQYIVQRELEQAVRYERANGGSVVVMDPFTGEVLAMASMPDFNPNAFSDATESAQLNRAIQGAYEPGSTLKVVTAAAALAEGVMTPSTLIDTNPGYVIVPRRGKPIREDKDKNYGVLSLENVIVKSSNIGAIRIGERLGTPTLMRHVRQFGFGDRLLPDLAGESRGLVKEASNIDESGRASISMGHEISVTPLQLATAMSVFANGGVLVQPRLVRAIRHSNGRREVSEPAALRRVLSPEVAATMTAIMEGVTDHGTARRSALSRYHIAGKTGTTQKFVNGRYSDTDYDVSFAGFVPSRRPAFAIVAVIDTPRTSKAYGGSVAAPLFKRIAEAALQLRGVPPTIDPEIPVMRATARPPSPIGTPAITQVGGRPVMPDLTGVGLRGALRIMNRLQIRVTAEGDGAVIAQSPAPGTVIEPGMSGVLRLRRQPAERSER